MNVDRRRISEAIDTLADVVIANKRLNNDTLDEIDHVIRALEQMLTMGYK